MDNDDGWAGALGSESGVCVVDHALDSKASVHNAVKMTVIYVRAGAARRGMTGHSSAYAKAVDNPFLFIGKTQQNNDSGARMSGKT
nr:hypothetical protein [uncultured Acidocella sp.]